jgi:hypothetical protein
VGRAGPEPRGILRYFPAATFNEFRGLRTAVRGWNPVYAAELKGDSVKIRGIA